MIHAHSLHEATANFLYCRIFSQHKWTKTTRFTYFNYHNSQNFKYIPPFNNIETQAIFA